MVFSNAADLPIKLRKLRFSATTCFSSVFSSSKLLERKARFNNISTSSRFNGLVTKCQAPRRMASTAVSTEPYAVIMIATGGFASDIAASSTSMPLSPPKRKSVSNKVTSSFFMTAVASLRFEARKTSKSPSKAARKPSRVGRSSSTINNTGNLLIYPHLSPDPELEAVVHVLRSAEGKAKPVCHCPLDFQSPFPHHARE